MAADLNMPKRLRPRSAKLGVIGLNADEKGWGDLTVPPGGVAPGSLLAGAQQGSISAIFARKAVVGNNQARSGGASRLGRYSKALAPLVVLS